MKSWELMVDEFPLFLFGLEVSGCFPLSVFLVAMVEIEEYFKVLGKRNFLGMWFRR